GREKVKRAGDMLRTVLPCPQVHNELKLVLALQLPLQFIVTDEFHVIFHGSISCHEGSRMSTSPHLASARARPTSPALLRESGSVRRGKALPHCCRHAHSVFLFFHSLVALYTPRRVTSRG